MQFNNRLVKNSITSILVVILVAVTPGIANASESNSLGDEEMAQYQEAFSELGIDTVTQAVLIDKIGEGEILDSWTSIPPVESSTWTDESNEYTLDVYADGSRGLTTLELPEVVSSDSPLLRGSACSVPDGPYPNGWSFNGCRIDRQSGGLSITYYLNGNTRGVNSATHPARITGSSPVSCSFVGGSTKTSWYVGAASGAAAWGIGYCVVTVSLGGGTFTYGLRVNVTTKIAAIDL